MLNSFNPKKIWRTTAQMDAKEIFTTLFPINIVEKKLWGWCVNWRAVFADKLFFLAFTSSFILLDTTKAISALEKKALKASRIIKITKSLIIINKPVQHLLFQLYKYKFYLLMKKGSEEKQFGCFQFYLQFLTPLRN